MRRIPFITLVLLIAALSLAACSGGSDDASSAAAIEQAESTQGAAAVSEATGQAEQRDADESEERESGSGYAARTSTPTAQFIAASAQRTADESSYRFRWSIALDGIPELHGGVTLTGGGAVDSEAGLVAMDLDFGPLFEALSSMEDADGDIGVAMSLFGEEPISFIIDGTTMYLRWPLFAGIFGPSTPWIAFEDIEATGSPELPGIEGFVAPDQYLEAFGALFDLSEVGSEMLDGVTTTRYEGIFDLVAAAEAAGENGLEPFGGADAFLDLPGGISELPISIWVDEDERVRRFSMSFSDEVDGVPVSFEMVYELFGFGESISVVLPDPSEVTFVDGTSLFGGFGGEFGETNTGTITSGFESYNYGDDPSLDALWDGCTAGDMDECDDLYFDSPAGSEYEVYGDTCGYRQPTGSGMLCTQRA